MSRGAQFRPVHIDRTGEFTLDLPLGHAFPLFSPEGERAWIPGWDPDYLHPDHPSNAAGTLFRTTHNGEETLWLVLTYGYTEAIARYCRITPGSRIGTVQVHCREEGLGRTRATVSYSLTGLSTAGNAVLTALTTEKYAAMLQDWRAMITASQKSRPG